MYAYANSYIRQCSITIELVPLSPMHPDIRVSQLFYSDLEEWLKAGVKEGSFIFRKIVGVLIPNPEVWASSGGVDKIFERENYRDHLWAAHQFVNKGRPSFTMRETRALVGQLIQEAKRKIDKTMNFLREEPEKKEEEKSKACFLDDVDTRDLEFSDEE